MTSLTLLLILPLLAILKFDPFDNALGSQNTLESQKFLDIKILWDIKTNLKVVKRSPDSVDSVDSVDNVANVDTVDTIVAI